MKAYVSCKKCKSYCRVSWPEYQRWTGRHQVFTGCRVEVTFSPPPGFKSLLSPLEELAREGMKPVTPKSGVQVLRRAIPSGLDLPPARSLDTLPFKPCPSWLGDFHSVKWGGGSRLPFPKQLSQLVELLESKVQQQFNTVFLRRYLPGEFVKRHRDPLNNVGYTVIGVLGEWEGATTSIELPDGCRESITLCSGDIMTLPCTIEGQQGPFHSVSPVESGVRFALILNTVI